MIKITKYLPLIFALFETQTFAQSSPSRSLCTVDAQNYGQYFSQPKKQEFDILYKALLSRMGKDEKIRFQLIREKIDIAHKTESDAQHQELLELSQQASQLLSSYFISNIGHVNGIIESVKSRGITLRLNEGTVVFETVDYKNEKGKSLYRLVRHPGSRSSRDSFEVRIGEKIVELDGGDAMNHQIGCDRPSRTFLEKQYGADVLDFLSSNPNRKRSPVINMSDSESATK